MESRAMLVMAIGVATMALTPMGVFAAEKSGTPHPRTGTERKGHHLLGGGQQQQANTDAVIVYRGRTFPGTLGHPDTQDAVIDRGPVVFITHPEINTPTPRFEKVVRQTHTPIDENSNMKFELGLNYLNGDNGIEANFEKAQELILEAAKAGNPRAEHFMGLVTLRNSETASVEWFLKAANQNYAPSQAKLGDIYNYGKHVPRDSSIAAKWYRKAADQGDTHSQKELAKYYENTASPNHNATWAANWYQRAAQKGDAEAQVKVGDLLMAGTGLFQNKNKAFESYRKAALASNLQGIIKVAECYNNGTGAPQDHREAYQWFLLAAEKGSKEAYHQIGLLARDGKGMPQSNIKAHMLLSLASDNGLGEADLKSVEANMSQAEIKKARAERDQSLQLTMAR